MENLSEGKVCSKCGEWKLRTAFSIKRANRDGLQTACRACARAYQKEWYTKHREYDLARVATYHRLHPEKALERSRKYNAIHGYPLRTGERERERNRFYTRRWSATRHTADPGWEQARKAKRRAHKARTTGAYTANEWRGLCAYYHNLCLCCGGAGKMSPDHVIPLSRGGTNDITNIQPLCLPCNLRKRITTTDYRDPGTFQLFLVSLQEED